MRGRKLQEVGRHRHHDYDRCQRHRRDLAESGRDHDADGVDPLKILASATGGAGTPTAIGTNGRLLATALIPFGGGVGQSIVWDRNGGTVVVGLVRGDQPKLEAVARAVAAKLG